MHGGGTLFFFLLRRQQTLVHSLGTFDEKLLLRLERQAVFNQISDARCGTGRILIEYGSVLVVDDMIKCSQHYGCKMAALCFLPFGPDNRYRLEFDEKLLTWLEANSNHIF